MGRKAQQNRRLKGNKIMMETSKTNFVKHYEPGEQSRVELKNGRILDVVNGRYFDARTRVILKGRKA